MSEPDIYSTEHKKLTKSLIKARQNAGLTQKQVADKLGFTQGYMSKIENGQVNASFILVKKLAKLYGVEVGEL